MDKIIIIDDKGEEHQFTNIKDLVAYANSFSMSWLPDGFSWELFPKKLEVTHQQYQNWLKDCPVNYNQDSTDDDGDDEIHVVGFVVPKNKEANNE